MLYKSNDFLLCSDHHRHLLSVRPEDDPELFQLCEQLLGDPVPDGAEPERNVRAPFDGADVVHQFRAAVAAESQLLEELSHEVSQSAGFLAWPLSSSSWNTGDDDIETTTRGT